MAKVAGRAAVISKAGTPIGGVRVTTIKRDNTPIDVTDRDSAGLVELLSVPSTSQLTLDVEGVYEDPVLRDISMTAATSPLLTDITFKFADALAASDTITGNFFMTSYEEGNPHDDASTFTASFVSSGTWTLA
jgi:predicted secreted protein